MPLTTSQPPLGRSLIVYHFCRMQMPAICLRQSRFMEHLARTYAVFAAKNDPPPDWNGYIDQLYSLDWYLACACLDNDPKAWEYLFAVRTGRSDCLLIDALRSRAVRLYPRNEEKQEEAVAELWSHLLVAESAGSIPVMARYDGQRPLAPWLIRVFQNWHVSRLRTKSPTVAMPDDDLAMPLPEKAEDRWHDVFCRAAREWLADLPDAEMLLLGLRWRYRLSQREISQLYGVHEGTISRQTDKLRDRCIDTIRDRLIREGWTGDDVEGFILTELGSLLVDEPRLSADQLTALLAAKGKKMPAMV